MIPGNNKLTEKEQALIRQLRLIKYGRVIIYMENHEPVRIDEIKENIKL